MALKDILGSGPLGAIKEIWTGRQKKKMAEKTLEAKIAEKKLDHKAQIDFAPHEWERLAAWANESTWKDEYLTVSVMAIFNIIIIGGIAQAFGFPQILEGVKIALVTLNDVMVMSPVNPETGVTEFKYTPLGTIIVVTIFAGLGVYGWKKLL